MFPLVASTHALWPVLLSCAATRRTRSRASRWRSPPCCRNRSWRSAFAAGSLTDARRLFTLHTRPLLTRCRCRPLTLQTPQALHTLLQPQTLEQLHQPQTQAPANWLTCTMLSNRFTGHRTHGVSLFGLLIHSFSPSFFPFPFLFFSFSFLTSNLMTP